jgi:type I restriction enzyme S subunit
MFGWEAKPLGEVCTIKPPKAEARTKLAGADEVSFAPMEDLGIGVKYLQPHRTRHLDEVSGSYTYFSDGDVLLAKITPCFENGKLGVARSLMNGVGFGSSEYIVLRPAPTLDAEFLYYYLARPTFLEEGARTMTGAVGHKRVTKEFVESYQIPLPPVAEQRRIVAILDEAFEGIATAKDNAEKNLQNARELFDSWLRSLVNEQAAGSDVTTHANFASGTHPI